MRNIFWIWKELREHVLCVCNVCTETRSLYDRGCGAYSCICNFEAAVQCNALTGAVSSSA